MAIPQDLLEILACPDCKTPVVLDGKQLVCRNGECRRVYEIRDDIPIMMIEESTVLGDEEWRTIMAAHPAPAQSKAAHGGESDQE